MEVGDVALFASDDDFRALSADRWGALANSVDAYDSVYRLTGR